MVKTDNVDINSFVENCVQYIKKTFPAEDLKDICIVFPGKRAGLFFKENLKKYYPETFIMPDIISINELFVRESQLIKTENLYLLSRLYNIFLKHTGWKQTFDEFYYWGNIILNDFDDIDKYMIDARDLFQNLSSIKNIEDDFSYLTEEQKNKILEFWSSLKIDKKSIHQEEFIFIWEKLYPIYRDFKKSLSEEGIAYEGMIYREIAEKHKDTVKEFFSDSEKYIFIGFNALNKCEKTVFKFLKNKNKGIFLWDFDDSYIDNDSENDAGYFIKNLLEDFPLPENFENKNYSIENIEINTYACCSRIAQTKALHEVLSKEIKNNCFNPAESAIILPDEEILIPVLYSLPPEIKDFNITMGYPLKNNEFITLIKTILELQKNAKNGKFYIKNVIEILNNPFISRISDSRELLKSIKKSAFLRITADFFKNTEILNRIFIIKPYEEILSYLKDLMILFDKHIASSYKEKIFEQEILIQLFKELNKLEIIIKKGEIEIKSIDILSLIVNKAFSELKIHFLGEPLKGFQILGILETRNIDFKNLYILSMNEGTFPSVSTSPSFIPQNLRYGFGIPTAKHQDAIFSYYFYRLLHKPQKINLFYYVPTDTNSKNEKSRFVSQIQYLNKKASDEIKTGLNVNVFEQENIIFTKDDELFKEKEKEFFSGKYEISANMLNSYLDCSLKFYLTYIKGLKESEEYSELLDDAGFGNIFHKAMELIYIDFYEKTIDKALFKQNFTNDYIEKKLKEAFSQILDSDNFDEILSGYNSINYSVLLEYIKKIINYDKNFLPIKLKGFEKKFNTVYTLKSGNKVSLSGKIDRLDESNGITRIIDYKTGKSDYEFKGLKSLFSGKKRNKAVFQMFFYSFILNSLAPQSKVQAMLYFTRQTEDNQNFNIYNSDTKQTINDYSSVKDDFEVELRNTIEEIFDKDKFFGKTDNANSCVYCAFKNICHR